jgi:hypothetical protein
MLGPCDRALRLGERHRQAALLEVVFRAKQRKVEAGDVDMAHFVARGARTIAIRAVEREAEACVRRIRVPLDDRDLHPCTLTRRRSERIRRYRRCRPPTYLVD